MEEVSETDSHQNDSPHVKNELAHDSTIDEDPYSRADSTKDEKKSKGTKRKASIDLQQYTCEVCQVKLNSASQAYQHFQGKIHQGKVKMLEMAAEVKAPPPTSNNHLTAAHSTSDISPSTIEHYCTLCQKIFNSKNQADQHFSGKAHRHKLSEQAIANIHVFPNVPSGTRPPLGTNNNKPVTKQPDLIKMGSNVKSPLFSCEHCHITLNSQRQYDQHINGLRHKIIVGKAKPPPPPQGEEPGWQEIRYKKLTTAITTIGLLSNSGTSASINPGGTRLGQYYCKDCDVSVNSPIQLQQHITSAKHNAKINGVVTVKKKPARLPGATGPARGGGHSGPGPGRGGGLSGTGPRRGGGHSGIGPGRGGHSGTGPGRGVGHSGTGLGRGAGNSRAVPSLSTNFVRGGQISNPTVNQIPIQPTVNQIPTGYQNGSALNNQNAAYQPHQPDLYSSYSSYPAHVSTNYSTLMF